MVVNKLMNNENQAMGVKASSEGIKKIQQRMAELVRPDNKEKRGWTQSNLAERSGVDLSTVRRLLHGIPIRYDFLSWIAEAVGLNVEELIERPLPDLQESSLDWLVICEEMLDKQRDANELRRKATGLGAENHVYMPLDLVETKAKKQEQTPNNQDESGNKLKTEEVIYPHAQFLEDLLNWRRENKHIAIAGEAGAGKTTFLVTIAEKLKNSQHLPIFIGLADLQGRSLKTYINDVWLPHALNEREATEEQKESLFQQFQAGKIWLLLDALDEMQAKSSAEALDKINREIKEVIGQSRVVMTCRLNVWDAYINRLPNFDTFRMGNLSIEQIDSFISQWFSFAECPENASILQAKLKEANRDRIRDMVTHPLRLALLCQAFYRNPHTDLPETKAGLYELFVRYFYEWKPNIVDEDLRTQDSLREELHQALGKLAIAAIDSDAGFRLSRSFAVKEMGNSDLFNLACNVGWLSLIDRNDLDEEVYSFFHATFQEYFAALAINDWSYFLIHNSDNISQGNYRIFYSKWTEVFLFWLGRDEEYLLSHKQSLMHDLINFKDDCHDLYSEKAFVLVAKGTSEFYDFDEIVDFILKVVNKVFSYFNESECDWIEELIPYYQLKKKSNILYQMDSYFVWLELEELHNDLMKRCQSFLDDNKLDLISYTSWSPNLKDYLKCLMVQEFMILEIAGNIDPKHPIIVERLIFQLAYDYMLIGHNVSTYDLLNLYKKNCLENPLAIKALKNKISIYEEILSRHENELDLALKNEEENTNDLPKIKNQKIEAINNIKLYINELGQTLAIIDASYKHIDIQFDRTHWKHTSIFDLGFNVNIIQNQSLDSLTTQELLDLINPQKFHVHICYQLKERGMSNFEILKKLLNLLDEVWTICDMDTVHRFRILLLLEEFASSEDWMLLTKCFVREYLLGISDPDFIYSELDMKGIYSYLITATDSINYSEFNDICQICSRDLGLLPLSPQKDISYLYSQFIDIDAVQEKIDRNTDHPEIRCLVIDIRHLEQEIDPNVIAKKLTNKIFNSIGRRIPVVQDVSCLERELLNLKFDLGVEKLAIALYGKSANEAIAQLCQSLAPIHIHLFTGEQTSEQLINEVKAWLRRINLEYN